MHEGQFVTYIVASHNLALYIGITQDLEKRVFEHKLGLCETFTAIHNCDRLVWFESFPDPHAAIRREKQLKGWTRARKLALIQERNPTCMDLSESWYTVDLPEWVN